MEMGNILIVSWVVAAWEARSGKPDIGNNLKVFLNAERNQDTYVDITPQNGVLYGNVEANRIRTADWVCWC
jgi:hypothetical protein